MVKFNNLNLNTAELLSINNFIKIVPVHLDPTKTKD